MGDVQWLDLLCGAVLCCVVCGSAEVGSNRIKDKR